MRKFRRYHRITAVFLLVVYAFITAPVQLWHHHRCTQASSTHGTDEQAPDSKHSGKFISEKCPVCDHQYSVYTGETFTPRLARLYYAAAKDGSSKTICYNAPKFSLPGRAPPIALT